MIVPRILLALFVLWFTEFAGAAPDAPAPALPEIPARQFAIIDHGAAVGDDKDNAKAIQETIDAASAAGGGFVEVPPGEFLSGPVRFADHIALRLADGATLKMLPMDKYPGGKTVPPNFITAQKCHDIEITGTGTIDGQGSPWWPFAKSKEGARRPRMIAFSGCERVLIEKVKLVNSPMFHITVGNGSSNVTVRGVTIHAPASTGHNTDACDVGGKHMLIEDCDVSVGDDNFTCGGGTSDVHIRRCTYGYGHGVSIGSPIKGGVSDITVEGCTFTNTEAGIRIKSDRDRGGIVQHMVYRNLKMTNVNFPILIYGSYMASEKALRDLTNLTPEAALAYPARALTDLTPVYRDITFSNITATTAPAHRAGLFFGLPEAPVSEIVLSNVNITADKPFGIYNAKGVRFENCHIVTPDGENKFSTGNAEVTVGPR